MPSVRLISFSSAAAVLFGAVFYAIYVRPFFAFFFGVDRVVQPLSDFPFACRRIHHPLLEGCEDLYLDDDSRRLYLACAGTESRQAWNPGSSKFDYSKRRAEGAHVAVLDIDSPGKDGLFGVRVLQLRGGPVQSLDTVGFDGEIVDQDRLRLWIVNMGPSERADGTVDGANATIEVFDVNRQGDTMVHFKTFSHKAIQTPNRVAATRDGGFVMTNDKSVKSGFRRELDIALGGGNVVHCSSSGCQVAAASGFAFPNGLTRGQDGLYYVPNVFKNKIAVMELKPDFKLQEITSIKVHMPVDNLSVDRDGTIFAAAFPKAQAMIESLEDPLNVSPPATIWRIQRLGDEYKVSKIIEDKDGQVVSGVTTAVHDARTGRLFMGGVVTPFITICDPL